MDFDQQSTTTLSTLNSPKKSHTKVQKLILPTKLRSPRSPIIHSQHTFITTRYNTPAQLSPSSYTRSILTGPSTSPTKDVACCADKLPETDMDDDGSSKSSTVIKPPDSFSLNDQSSEGIEGVIEGDGFISYPSNENLVQPDNINKSSVEEEPNPPLSPELVKNPSVTGRQSNSTKESKGKRSKSVGGSSKSSSILTDRLSGSVSGRNSNRTEPESNRRRSYNLAETRKFIQSKRDSRYTTFSDNLKKSQEQRDIIQERLKALSQNTRKIIGNNIKNAQRVKEKGNRINSPTRSRINTKRDLKILSNRSGRKSLTDCSEKKPIPVLKKPEPIPIIKPLIDPPTIEMPEKIPIPKICDKINHKDKSDSVFLSKISETVEGNHRIGVLRRPDNEPLTVPSATYKSNQTEKTDKFEINKNSNIPIEPTGPIQTKEYLIDDDLQLTIPTGSLKPISIRDEPPKSDLKSDKTNQSLPYWLRPTQVQIYPYNFIMAVRKKLEALTEPVIHANQSSNQNRINEPSEMSQSNRTNQPKQSSSSDFQTNFSSITLNFASHSNTTSDVSSITSEHDNRRIINSTKLSKSRRQKKTKDGPTDSTKGSEINVSPLSVRKIEQLKIVSKSQPTNIVTKSKPNLSGIEFSRGSDVTDLNPSIFDDSKIQSNARTTIEYRNMLEEIQTGLNRVISVNQKLQSAIMKPITRERKSNRNRVNEAVQTSFEQLNLIDRTSPSESNMSERYTDHFEDGQTTDSEVIRKSNSSNDQRDKSVTNDRNDSDNIIESESNSSIHTVTSAATIEVDENLKLIALKSTEDNGNRSDSINTEITASNDLLNIRNDGNSVENRDYSDVDAIKRSLDENTGSSTVQKESEPNDQKSLSIILNEFTYEHSNQSNGLIVESELNQTIGNEIWSIFNQTVSGNNSSLLSGDNNFSYSSIGMYEKLIQTEVNKSEHLTSLIKLREKCLLDRTKGQLAWLEIQKQRLKERGDVRHLSRIRKKQRALLLKFEQEKREIKELLKSLDKKSSENKSYRRFQLDRMLTNINVSRRNTDQSEWISKQPVKGFEIEGGKRLEAILKKREEELQKRRAHVDHLIKWHQRLDIEEQRVQELEGLLMSYTSRIVSKSKSSNEIKSRRDLKKIKDIDRSLNVLEEMNTSGTTCSTDPTDDYVETLGSNLNKLWRRLTGNVVKKYRAQEMYRLSKSDLEQLYESAKLEVLNRFSGKDGKGIEQLVGRESVVEQSTEYPNEESDNRSEMIEEKPITNSSESTSNDIVPKLNLDDLTSDTSESQPFNGNPDDGCYFSDNLVQPDSDKGNLHLKLNNGSDKSNSITDILTGDLTMIEDTSFPIVDVTIYNPTIVIPTDTDCMTLTDNHLSPDNTMEFSDKEKSYQSDMFEVDDDKITETDRNVNNNEIYTDPDLSSQTIDDNVGMPSTEPFDNDTADSQSIESVSLQSCTELEQRLIHIGDSMNRINESIERASIMERSMSPDRIKLSGEIEVVGLVTHLNDDGKVTDECKEPTTTTTTVEVVTTQPDHSNQMLHGIQNKMPDIINEAEVIRRQQKIQRFEREIPHPEGTDSPYPYNIILREIPNKPPPPYVPPAPGSPMTQIYPSDDRIQEIVFRRTKELYLSDRPDQPSPSILDENITNIYERIILDVCEECMAELRDESIQFVNYSHSLALYNPPDRLVSIQNFILQKIRNLLHIEWDLSRRSRLSAASLGCSKRKRDVVDEILIIEMIENESKWTNFDLEEMEILEKMGDDLMNEPADEYLQYCLTNLKLKRNT